MRDVMLWVQQIQDLSWIGLVTLLVFGAPTLLTALGKFLVTLTAIWSSNPDRRDTARRTLESLGEAQTTRFRRRPAKKP